MARRKGTEEVGPVSRGVENMGDIPLPTLMPPKKTGTILFLVSVGLAIHSLIGENESSM
jgi:hypothetical protein